jgi:molybdenum cofactor biosynthesis enzyme MoaA
MAADCVIIANSNTTSEERRKPFLTANDWKSRWRFGLGLLRRNRYNPLQVARISSEIRKVQKVLDEQESLLIEDLPRNWSSTQVINYIRAGREVPNITRDNARQYITWLSDITLNGVIVLDYLARHGLSGELIQTFGFESEERVNRLLARRPVAVVVSTTFITLDVILALKEIFDRVKQHSPRTRVIVGSSMLHWYMGNYPEIVPIILDCCDLIIDDAQGFHTLCDVVHRLKRGAEIDTVPNLILRRRGKICRTRREPEKTSIDDLAPDWGRWLPRGYAGRVRVQTSQGCPFTCRFCDFRLMNATDYKSVDVLREELRSLHAIGVTKIDFVDDLLTLPEKRLQAICRMMLEERFEFSWFCLSRSAGLSDDSVRLMAEAGCSMVNIGMESADPTVLNNMKKRTDPSAARRQMDAFHHNRIAIFSNFILGFPGETDASLARTVEFLNSTPIDAYFLTLFIAGRGTGVDTPEFRKQFRLEGEYRYWKHGTGTAREMAGKISDFVAGVSDTILRVDGLDEMQMLLDAGYAREDLARLAPIMKGLATWSRNGTIRPQDVEASRGWLQRLAALEGARPASIAT